MARIPTGSVDFISCSQNTNGQPASLSFIGCNVDTSVPGNINFFGANVDKCPDAIIFYQIN